MSQQYSKLILCYEGAIISSEGGSQIYKKVSINKNLDPPYFGNKKFHQYTLPPKQA